MPFARRTGKRLAFERLEGRSLMAGDVTAIVVDGTLYIGGDNQNNTIYVQQGTQSGEFVIGQSTDTTVNGRESVTISGVTKGWRINLKNGNDRLILLDGVTAEGNVKIRMGKGADLISIGPRPDDAPPQPEYVPPAFERNLTIDLGAGDDRLHQNPTHVHGNQLIVAGTGDDGLWINDNSIPASDYIDPAVDNLRVDGAISIDLGAGDDTFLARKIIAGTYIHVKGGSGDDNIESFDNQSRRSLIEAGSGNDRFESESDQYERLRIAMGADDDRIRRHAGEIQRAHIGGGAGSDLFIDTGGFMPVRVKRIESQMLD